MNTASLFSLSNPSHSICKAILKGYEPNDNFEDQNAIRSFESQNGLFIKNFGGKRLCGVPKLGHIHTPIKNSQREDFEYTIFIGIQ
jgi:hypothetical protein